jgi:hypothetical protein
VANPKHPRQPARERLSADDLELPVQTRERTPRRAPTYRVAADAPAKEPAVAPPRARPPGAPPLLPPEQNVAPAREAPAGSAKARYPGTMIDEAIQRRESGRLGQPQPPAQRPAARAQQAHPKSAAVMSAAAPARQHEQRPPAKPVERAPRELERSARSAAAPAPRPVRRQAQSELIEEFVLVHAPTLGPNQALIACVIVSVVLVWALFTTPMGASLGFYTGPLTLSEWFSQTLGQPEPEPSRPASEPGLRTAPMSAPTGENSVVGPPTITAEEIDAVLRSYGSPAAGSGMDFYNLGIEYGIDPAYALAFFIHESSAGTNPGWAGIKPDGTSTHNVGNIICAGYATCYNRFRDYGSWSEGIDDWYKLIAAEYINGRGAYTVEQIIQVYAPSFENNVPAYIQAVNTLVNDWRQGKR